MVYANRKLAVTVDKRLLPWQKVDSNRTCNSKVRFGEIFSIFSKKDLYDSPSLGIRNKNKPSMTLLSRENSSSPRI